MPPFDLPHSKVIFSKALQELAHSTLIVSATNTSIRRLTHFGLSHRLLISPIDVDGVIRFGWGAPNPATSWQSLDRLQTLK